MAMAGVHLTVWFANMREIRVWFQVEENPNLSSKTLAGKADSAFHPAKGGKWIPVNPWANVSLVQFVWRPSNLPQVQDDFYK